MKTRATTENMDKKETSAALMLHRADKHQYQGFKNLLAQNYAIGINNYSRGDS